ncbi:MAG: acetyl-CoA acetyltransferase [Sphingomonadales bacterium]|nr:acetyl-CoA acetyltransferase [Sphingomonadales bacterium]MDE2569115.1 acetyl-CoA acetyltransferase [Sphingomonadales bacterium]
MNPDNLPVIVGVGQVNDRPQDPTQGLNPVGLMAAALRKAESDAGANGLLADADWLGVVRQISFPDIADAAPPVAEVIGADRAETFQTHGPNGDSPVMLLNEAANRIGAGEITVALVSGAEALRTAAAKVAAAEGGRKLDATREASHRRKLGYAQSHGLVAPVDVYPLYENALRASLGQTFEEAQAESGAIWSLFSEVAAANENAWIRKPVRAEDVVAPSDKNRPIAWPYTKLQVANAAVNQGAGFIVTSVGEARRRGIPEDKWIYVGNGAAAHECEDFLSRDRFDRSPSMEVSIRRTLDLNALKPSDFDAVELYSCFPCIPKLARRVIDWPLDRPATVFGGLTFGGGPIGNYMSHAIDSMVDLLRAKGGTGLLFANGGFATHNHTIAVSSKPIAAASFPKSYEFQAEADAARGNIPAMDEGYVGPAIIETFTVFHHRDGSPRAGVIVARTPSGDRTLAHVPGEDVDTIARLTSGEMEPVGASGTIEPGEPLRLWRFA